MGIVANGLSLKDYGDFITSQRPSNVTVKPTSGLFPAADGQATFLVTESPVFEVVEDFEVKSNVCADGTTVRVLLRRKLNYVASRLTRGPFYLDLRVGSSHTPYYGISEEAARECACRFLLKHVNGVVPTLN
jgi:hypothetical protein